MKRKPLFNLVNVLFQAKVKARELRGKKKDELEKQLEELKKVSCILVVVS